MVSPCLWVINYFLVKAERDNFEKHRDIEYWEVDNIREKEVQEIRDIYAEKGFKGELLEQVVEVITANEDMWVHKLGFSNYARVD